ncbi:cation-transporting P-type ATPase 13A2 [Nematocida sp. AWRm80]|nr:cation-transporting P-type ATPase 13A2 [Nematocida sp. AWRm80]
MATLKTAKEYMKYSMSDSALQGRMRRVPEWLYYMLSCLSLGVFHILCKTVPRIKIELESYKCSIERAEYILYENKLIPVHTETIDRKQIGDILYEYIDSDNGYIYKYMIIDNSRWIFNWVSKAYEQPEANFENCLSVLNRAEKEVLFGKNILFNRVDRNIKVLFNCLFTEINVYIILGILLWIQISYKEYALIIFCLMLYSVLVEYRKEVKKNKQITKMSEKKNDVYLLKENTGIPINSSEVVVGDLLVMAPFIEVPCDCMVIRGTLAVDEGFVTGESVPVLKKEGSEVLGGTVVLQALSDKSSSVECPELNEFIQSGNYTIVRATRTSFGSAKGKAFKNLTGAKITKPPIYFDAIWIICALAIASLPFLTWMFMFLLSNQISLWTCIFYMLDMLYSILSPSLPTSIWVGMSICSRRLSKRKIICKDLAVSNIAGSITRACFDKTGTLTEEGLDIKCINVNGTEHTSIDTIDNPDVFHGLQLCHSVENIGDKLIGDPLDIKLIQFTKSMVSYQKTHKGTRRVILCNGEVSGTIDQLFDFDPNLRRMSSIAEYPNGESYFLSKGSPEAISSLCDQKSIPSAFSETIHKYTLEGYRVLALAGKKLRQTSLDTPPELSSLEKDLSLMGILVFENKIKKTSRNTIKLLSISGIDSIICTGDALLTAVSVATHCGIIEQHVPVIYPVITTNTQVLTAKEINTIDWKCINDEVVFDKMILKVRKGQDYSSYVDFVIAIEGTLFNLLTQSPDYKKLLKKRCKVYARLNPYQKSCVVQMYKESELVCFVGDGANDCNAIQEADVGISLSNSEGTAGEFCVSSYVSYTKEISSILAIIREGKCTIVTTISKLEQMLILTVTQFIALMILQTRKVFLSDTQNIYTDIFISIPLAVIMSQFKASHKMSKKRPKTRLLTKKVIFPFLIHCFVHGMHIIALLYFFDDLGLKTINPPFVEGNLSEYSHATTGVFFVFNFQVLYSGFCYTPGSPFREKKSSNLTFIGFFIGHFLFLLFLLLFISIDSLRKNDLSTYLVDWFNLLPISMNAAIYICILCLTDVLLIQMLSVVVRVLLRS